MIDWSVLGIEETTSVEAITNGYRQMLAVTNPEDNPVGFMLLRNTYEQALQYDQHVSLILFLDHFCM